MKQDDDFTDLEQSKNDEHLSENTIKSEESENQNITQKKLSRAEKLEQKKKEQLAIQEKKQQEKLEKQELKQQKRKERREIVVPIYKWFFILIFLMIPIVNIFLFIYWGFFSDRINKNIRNIILASILLAIIIIALAVVIYFNLEQLDPRIVEILTNLFDGLYDLLSNISRQIEKLPSINF